jgi:hypothetical protein
LLFSQCYDIDVVLIGSVLNIQLRDMTGWGWGCWGVSESEVQRRFDAQFDEETSEHGFPMNLHKDCGQDQCCINQRPFNAAGPASFPPNDPDATPAGIKETVRRCITWFGREVPCTSSSARCQITISFKLEVLAHGYTGSCQKCYVQ